MSLHNSHSVLTSLIILCYRAYIRLISQLVIQTNEHPSLVIGSQVDRDKYRCKWGTMPPVIRSLTAILAVVYSVAECTIASVGQATRFYTWGSNLKDLCKLNTGRLVRLWSSKGTVFHNSEPETSKEWSLVFDLVRGTSNRCCQAECRALFG